jgi:hypothetical protein
VVRGRGGSRPAALVGGGCPGFAKTNPALLSGFAKATPCGPSLTRGEAMPEMPQIEKGRGTLHLAASGSKLIAYELSLPPVLQAYTPLGN